MKFEKALKKQIDPLSFCVVGNSPIELETERGKLIDGYKTVIRFNDYSVSFEKDYGKKTDIWVRATNDVVIETLNEKNSKQHDLVIFRSQSDKNSKSVQHFEKFKKPYVITPKIYEQHLSGQLGAIPSTGLLFLYILKENKYVITKRNVFGFSFFDDEDIKKHGNHHYFNVNSNKNSNGILLAKHNWLKEKEFFKSQILAK